jgi:hypothetical protein
MNVFGQPAWFVLLSTCNIVNVSSVFAARFFLFRVLCHFPLSRESACSQVRTTTVYFWFYCLLTSRWSPPVPPPIPCYIKFVQHWFTERVALVGVPLALVEGLLCNAELATILDFRHWCTVSVFLPSLFLFLSVLIFFLPVIPAVHWYYSKLQCSNCKLTASLILRQSKHGCRQWQG